MSYGTIPLKVTNSFYYIKNSVKPLPYVMLATDINITELDKIEDYEPKGNMNFLENLKKNIKH